MRGPCYADPLFYFLEKALPRIFFVCGSFDVRTNEALPTIKSSGIGPIYRNPGVEDLVSGHEVPVFWNVYSRIKESRM